MPEQEKKKDKEKTEDIAVLLKKNISLTKEVLRYCKDTRRYILILKIISLVKVVIIVIPIILGIIYLPPFFKQYLGFFKKVVDLFQSSNIFNQIDPNLLEQLKEVSQ